MRMGFVIDLNMLESKAIMIRVYVLF